MTGGNPETWLAARLAAGIPAETWKPVPGWFYEENGFPVPPVPHQASDQGKIRNPKGAPLADHPTGRPKGLPLEEQYRRTNICTGGVKKPILIHHLVLAAHAPERRDGRDTRHLGRGRACRAWNWWPEGLVYADSQSQNEMDKPAEVRIAASRAATAARWPHAAPPPERTLRSRLRTLIRRFRKSIR